MKKTLSIIIAVLLCLSLLAGCGGSGGGSKAVHVKSIEEFVEAIRPGAEIVIEKGLYNMSEYLEAKYASSDFEQWAGSHPNVVIRDAFDGCELVIKDVSGLKISGAGAAADTELTVDPRYAAVLYFENCTDVDLANLTMGHTETGECSGNVVDLESCRKINIKGCDLYGCGVYGIGAFSGSGDINVEDTVIRDCEYGPYELYNVFGNVTFTNCKLTGSSGAGVIWDEYRNATVLFKNCEFGDWESYAQYNTEDGNITFEDCKFVDELPYYEGDFEGDGEIYIPEFEPDKFTKEAFPDTLLSFTRWDGYSMTDKSTGKTEMLAGSLDYYDDSLPYTIFYFQPDGTVTYAAAEAEYTLEWNLNEDGTVTIKDGDAEYKGQYYRNYHEDDWWDSWILMDMGTYTLWLY